MPITPIVNSPYEPARRADWLVSHVCGPGGVSYEKDGEAGRTFRDFKKAFWLISLLALVS